MGGGTGTGMGINGEEILKREYPGRGLLIGFDGLKVFTVYFLTGRSPSSQARTLEYQGSKVFTKPTDPNVLAQGNPELLIYNAIACTDNLITVSNGRQTDTLFLEQICKDDEENDMLSSFKNALNQWNYEPDAPNYTPRICGVATRNEAYIGIIKKTDNQIVREIYPALEGKLTGITTYTGLNEKPVLKPYEGKPFTIDIPRNNPIDNIDTEILAKKVWGLINPEFRVSVAAVVLNTETLDSFRESYIINKNQENQK